VSTFLLISQNDTQLWRLCSLQLVLIFKVFYKPTFSFKPESYKSGKKLWKKTVRPDKLTTKHQLKTLLN